MHVGTDTSGHYTGLGNEAVLVTGATSAASSADVVASDVNQIAAATSGVVTATVTGAAASVLKTNLVNAVETDRLTLTVLAEASGATKAADLVWLDGATAETVGVADAVVSLEGSADDLTYVYVGTDTSGHYTGLGNEAVLVTGKLRQLRRLMLLRRM